MPRRAILKDKLQAQPQSKEKAAPATAREKQALRNGGRGRLLGVHVSDAAYKQVRLLAVELDMRHNELLRAALNAFLKEHTKEPLA